MERIRDGVFESLKRAEGQRRTTAKDLEAIDKLKAETAAFKASGEWPSIDAVKALPERAEQVRQTLVKEYEAAQREYIRSKRDELATAVIAEREHFEKESDIVPWGDNLAAQGGEAGLEIGAVKHLFDVGPVASQAFRISVSARRLEGHGPLRIALPRPAGAILRITALPDLEGNLRVLLSVRDSLISADYGVPRPLSSDPVDPDDPAKLALWADEGKFTIESIQLKPITLAMGVAKAPAKAPGPASNAPRVEADPGSQLTQGSRWSGVHRSRKNQQSEQQAPAVVTVIRREGESVELSTRGIGGVGQFNFRFRIAGNQLVMEFVTVNLPEGAGVVRTEQRGSGTIDGDHLQFQYSWKGQEAGRPNRAGWRISGSFNLTRN